MIMVVNCGNVNVKGTNEYCATSTKDRSENYTLQYMLKF